MTPGTIPERLAHQAATRPHAPAYTFLPERNAPPITLTFAQLQSRAGALATSLLQHADPGDRAVLLFQPGLDMVLALFACMAARLVAVPLMLPRRAGARDSSLAILQDCTPRLALTGPGLLATRPDLPGRLGATLRWIEADAAADPPEAPPLPPPDPSGLALLQYTSGSTSSPKGVMVAHANLLANLEMIRRAMGLTRASTTLGWVPLFHDMGLIMQVMEPLHLGAHALLMPPAAFMQRPLDWLGAISTHRAEVTCAPNFAFDLCAARLRPDHMAGVDLSCLKVALNGAEPLHPATIARFAEAFAPYGFNPAAMYPGYGLAEATLLVSGAPRLTPVRTRIIGSKALQSGRAAPPATPDDATERVACGHPMPGERIAIVDPRTLTALPPLHVGEIWISGPNVTQGYWQQPDATAETFHARMQDDPAPWLRTGDLGFQDETRALYITGRMKDLIVIRGANHYPQDIERTARNAHPALRPDGGAAFSIPGGATERLVLVHELDRTHRHGTDPEPITAAIREAVAANHDLALHDITLIRPATLPKTTSGKVQRALTRHLWETGQLATTTPRPADG